MAEQERIGKTTFTTPSEREVVATRTFQAPRRLVWEAHANPLRVPGWMLGAEGETMPLCEIDLRPGGRWRFVWREADGSEMEMHGVYREVVEPERVVNTSSWGGGWAETLDSIVLTEKDGETTLVSRVLYPSKEDRDRALATGMKEGWSASYDRLERYLEALQRARSGVRPGEGAPGAPG